MSAFLNQVYLGDIMEVLNRLPDNSVDMILTDPDYNKGVRYVDGRSFTMEFEDYIAWYVTLAKELFRVLKDNGNLFFINFPRHNAYLWTQYLDKACYSVHEYVWCFNSQIGVSQKAFKTAHRSILHCTKSADNKWFNSEVLEPYINVNNNKRIRGMIERGTGAGSPPYSWIYCDFVNNGSREKTIHPCQLPQRLIETLILASTVERDAVLIPFGGASSEILAAKRLNRNYISTEIIDVYYNLIMERLEEFEKS